MPGQAQWLHGKVTTFLSHNKSLCPGIKKSLQDAETRLRLDDTESWEALFTFMQSQHGVDGIWAAFQLILEHDQLKVLTTSEAEALRDDILLAALSADLRIAALINAAESLIANEKFEWPDLYMKVIHFFLDKCDYENAVQWHFHLAPTFPPGLEVFGALLATFITDPTPKMQSCLTTMYVSNSERQLYDYIIPPLFASGQSKLARIWRKKLILFNDLPLTSDAKPFLKFLLIYYPSMRLLNEELVAAGLEIRQTQKLTIDNTDESILCNVPPRWIHSDSIVAKWLASSWTSVDFAINLIHKLGLRIMGPRSLQSLALRELDAKGVATRIAELERLGVEIASQTYCKILIFFARNGEDDLLVDLLHCDIHPDEFEDVETRQMLMAEAVRRGDWKRERLFQAIEWAMETGPASRRLNSLLTNELSKRSLTKARLVLDRMDALKVNVAQYSASKLLKRAFWGLGGHPLQKPQRCWPGGASEQSSEDNHLDQAIDITRRISCHDVAIPVQYWRVLIYNLGRLGRLDELEQLCLEIVNLYSPPYGGLIPVHRDDLPTPLLVSGGDIAHTRQMLAKSKHTTVNGQLRSTHDGQNHPHDILLEKTNGKERGGNFMPILKPPRGMLSDSDGKTNIQPTSMPADIQDLRSRPDQCKSERGHSDLGLERKADEKEYIPADLPFSHREHPVQRIFDTSLQRRLIRWGFDQTLAMRPQLLSSESTKPLGLAGFDMARGVRLLAILRDQGVLVDTQVLRSAIISRIAIGQVPGRPRDRARDSHEVSTQNLKRLVEDAWGMEILPGVAELTREIEAQKPKLWIRYPKLFAKAFDENH